MPNIRSFFDSRFLHHYDLPSPEVVAEIEKIEGEELMTQGGQTKRAPVLYLKGKKKALILNKGNTNTLIELFGEEVSNMIGKRITLYTDQTMLGKRRVGCVRIKNVLPEKAKP